MKKRTGLSTLVGLSVLVPGISGAADGGAIYNAYCAACHGDDGKGAVAGVFPPLAESEWVAGDAERSIQVVLHGLVGPVSVAGTEYNLAMPAQGATLDDEQLAAVLTYVRSNFGNTAGAVDAQTVARARAASADREAPWTAAEIRKKWPMPVVKVQQAAGALENVIMHEYHGPYKAVPDFSTVQPDAVEEEGSVLDVSKASRKDNFALRWTADLLVPETGKYTFKLWADDGARVSIDGRKVVDIAGIGPASDGRARSGDVELSKGKHALEVAYYEYTGQEEMRILWAGAGLSEPTWLTPPKDGGSGKKGKLAMPIVPPAGGAVMYRNFIAGTTPRAIGVGYDGGLNLAFSADHLGVELLWAGAFMDGGRHWTGRGQGNQPPAGRGVVSLTKTLPWRPVRLAEGEAVDHAFRGYQLDKKGVPTFQYDIGGARFADRTAASFEGGKLQFVRKVDVAVKEGAKTGDWIWQLYVDPPGNLTVEWGPSLDRMKPASASNTVALTSGTNTFFVRYTWK